MSARGDLDVGHDRLPPATVKAKGPSQKRSSYSSLAATTSGSAGGAIVRRSPGPDLELAIQEPVNLQSDTRRPAPRRQIRRLAALETTPA